jgi:hypothetical protein
MHKHTHIDTKQTQKANKSNQERVEEVAPRHDCKCNKQQEKGALAS